MPRRQVGAAPHPTPSPPPTGHTSAQWHDLIGLARTSPTAAQVLRWAQRGTLPLALLLHGDPGCGKTTTAQALLRALPLAKHMELNASNQRGASVMRSTLRSMLGPAFGTMPNEVHGALTVGSRASTAGVPGEAHPLHPPPWDTRAAPGSTVSTAATAVCLPKALLLDEADGLTVGAQAVLCSALEQLRSHGAQHIFIVLTVNQLDKLSPALQSHLTLLHVPALPAQDMQALLLQAGRAHGVALTSNAQKMLLQACGGDTRCVLSALQLAAAMMPEEDAEGSGGQGRPLRTISSADISPVLPPPGASACATALVATACAAHTGDGSAPSAASRARAGAAIKSLVPLWIAAIKSLVPLWSAPEQAGAAHPQHGVRQAQHGDGVDAALNDIMLSMPAALQALQDAGVEVHEVCAAMQRSIEALPLRIGTAQAVAACAALASRRPLTHLQCMGTASRWLRRAHAYSAGATGQVGAAAIE